MSSIITKLIHGLAGFDAIILVFAALAAGALWLSFRYAKDIEKEIIHWKATGNIEISKYVYNKLNTVYSIFLTLVSIFPLLGLLGTVWSLLGLDLSAGDMTNIKNNFFAALTSTAWGIIFSILFKLIHAPSSNFIENQIEDSRKMFEEYEIAKEKERR